MQTASCFGSKRSTKVLELLFAAFLAPKRPSSPRRDMPILDRSPASVDSAATSLKFKRISSNPH